MDLDEAIRRIREVDDLPPFSAILLELLEVVGSLDDDVARLRLRVRELEGTVERQTEVIDAGSSIKV